MILKFLLTWMAFASGPPEDMGHLQVQIEGQDVLFDLQVPARVTYNLGLPRGQVFKFGRLSEEFAASIFENALGVSELRRGGLPCEWQRREVLLGPGISRIRAVARCSETDSSLQFQLPFLNKESPEFKVAGTSNLPGVENFELNPKNPHIQLGMAWGWTPVLAGLGAFVLAVGSFLFFRKKERR